MRVFLDTCTFQLIYDYGHSVFEGEPIESDDPIVAQPNGSRNLEALYNIMQVESMGASSFSFVLSEVSLEEISARKDPGFTSYAYDVLDTWQITVTEQGEQAFTGEGLSWVKPIDDTQFEYLSSEDRNLLADALRLECDIFLTAEEKLPKHADHLNRELPLRVLKPYQFWEDEIAPYFRPTSQ